MQMTEYQEDIMVMERAEGESGGSSNKPFLNPAQLEKLAGIFQNDILPVMKAHEKEVENNPEMKAHLAKQAKKQQVQGVFRDMMTEVEEAIEHPGTPFANKLKGYIGELEGIVNPKAS